jgi:Uma2 family endonuclease
MSSIRIPSSRTKRVGRASNGMVMTPEEFDAAKDFDPQDSYELIHEVLIVSPPPGESERGPNDELGRLLMNYREGHPDGRNLDGTLPEQTVISGGDRRRADRVIWVGLGHIPDPRSDIPAIIVEFVSRRHRDRVRDYEEKRRNYLSVGVQEYWIIDRFKRIMTVVRRALPAPVELILKENDVYATPLLPGFELPLARLLKVADDWARGGKK